MLDESGKIAGKFSGKNIGEREIINYIFSKGDVVLLATDKARVPEKIKKISARLGIGVFSPKKDLSLDYKEKFYRNKELKKILRNIHEIDAYIAAYYALENVKDIIKKANKIVRNENEKVILLKRVFKEVDGEPISIYRKMFREEKEKRKEIKRKKKNIKKKINDYILIIKEKEKENKELIEEIKELKRNISKLLYIINTLGKYIINGDELIPKVSFLEKNKISYNRVFLDDIKYLKNIGKYREVFVPEELIKYINIEKEKLYVAEDYEDLEIFVKIKKYRKIEPKRENIEKFINELRKIYRSYISTHPPFRM